MFQFVDQLLVVVQFQLVHSVDQTLDVSHPWQEVTLMVTMETPNATQRSAMYQCCVS